MTTSISEFAHGTIPAMSKKKPNTDQSGADRTRLIADTEEAVNLAVQLRAFKMSVKERRKVSKSDVVNAILREALKAELDELEKHSK